jgi:transposase
MAGGRPTDYKPEYCKMLIEHMEQGYSYETFAAIIDVSKQTLYDWEKVHQEFLDSKGRAFARCQLFWEKLSIENPMISRQHGLNTGTWVFNMKNRFKWTDRTEIEAGEKTRAALKLAYNLEDDE